VFGSNTRTSVTDDLAECGYCILLASLREGFGSVIHQIIGLLLVHSFRL